MTTLNLQETYTGTVDNDTLTFVSGQNTTTNTRVDLGQGYDTIYLADGENRGIFNNIEHIVGGRGWNNYATIYQLPKEALFTNLDGVSLGTLLTGQKLTFEYNLDEAIFPNSLYCAVSEGANLAYISGAENVYGSKGIDTFYLFGEKNDVSFRETENIYGGIGNDKVHISDKLTLTQKIQLGEGYDELILSQFTSTPTTTDKNIGKISGVERVYGSTYTYDDIILEGFINNTSFENIDKVTGGTGHDTVTFISSYNNVLDLGKGVDKVIFSALNNTVNLSNVESLIGGNGQEIIVCKTALVNSNFDFADGYDSLYLGNFAKNTSYVSNAELVTGNLGYDTINFYGDNVTSVTSIESILGGIGSDNITLKDQLTNKLTINLGNGFDTLSLGNYINVGKVSGVEVINGGSDKDYITLTGTANTVTINDVEFVTGGEGKDTVTSNTILSGTIDLGGGIDKLVLNGEGNSVNISNIELLAGSSKTDSIAVKTQITEGVFDLKGGTDTVKLGDFTNSATFYNTEKIITGALNDSITLGNSLTSEIISYSNGNDSIINFDMTKDKIDITNSGTISFNQTNKTILDGSTVVGSYNDSTSDLILHFNSTNTNVTLTGVDTLSTTNFII